MSNISKDKLRRLPYDMRITLMSHHKDFLDEAVIILKEFPDRSHPNLEKIITSKFINNADRFLLHQNIDALNIIQSVLGTIKKPSFGHNDILKINNISFFLRRRNGEDNEMRDASNYIANYLLDSFEVVYYNNDSAFKNMYNAFIQSYNQLYSYIDSDNAAKKLIAYAANENVLGGIKEIYNRTNDVELRKDIMNSIGVIDILV